MSGSSPKEATTTEQDTTPYRRTQRVTWETLEGYVRLAVQSFVQELLQHEVTELLARRKSERRALVDAPAGYRNRHGKPRHLALGSGTITVRRPRVRGVQE